MKSLQYKSKLNEKKNNYRDFPVLTTSERLLVLVLQSKGHLYFIKLPLKILIQRKNNCALKTTDGASGINILQHIKEDITQINVNKT